MEPMWCQRYSWIMRRGSSTSDPDSIRDGMAQINSALMNADSVLVGLSRMPSMGYSDQSGKINDACQDASTLCSYVGSVAGEIDQLDARLSLGMNGPTATITAYHIEDITTAWVGTPTASPGSTPSTTPSTIDDVLQQCNQEGFGGISLEALKAFAKRAADEMKNGVVSDGTWLEMERLAAISACQQAFGAMLFNQVPAQDLAEVAMQLDADGYRIVTLGTLFGAATMSTCPPLKDTYAQDIMNVLTDSSNFSLVQGMSKVLCYGKYGTSFALNLAVLAYNYDKAAVDANGWPWGISPGQFSALPDPFGAVLTMLSSNPDAAQQFFNAGSPAPVDDVDIEIKERLKYLLLDRPWWYANSDGGDGLGKALLAATTGLRLTGDEHQATVSAELTSQIFAAIGGTLNAPKNKWEIPVGMQDEMAQIVASYISDLFEKQLALDKGTQLETPEVGDFSQGSHLANTEFFPGFPPGAVFKQQDMNAILQALGSDAKNVEIIGAGWAYTYRVYLAQVLETQNEVVDGVSVEKVNILKGDTDWLTNNIGVASKVLGYVIQQSVIGHNDDEATQLRDAQTLAAIVKFGTSLPIPGIGAVEKAASWALGQSTTAGFQAMEDDIKANADQQYSSIKNCADTLVTASAWDTIQAMYDQGFYDAKVVSDTKDPNIWVPKDDYFIPGTTTFDPQSDSCSSWMQVHSGPYGDIEDAFERGFGVTI